MPEYTHTSQIQDVQPQTQGCEECLKMGDRWVHLRLCLICGHVGCCDSSKNKHATKHFHRTKHPIMRSLEPGEDWRVLATLDDPTLREALGPPGGELRD